MSDFLADVIQHRRAATAAARDRASERELLARARDNVLAWKVRQTMAAGTHVPGDAFTRDLLMAKRERRMAVIAEVKRVSPALGVLTTDVDPAVRSRGYAAAGAVAISVLTEPLFWGGSFEDLAAVRDAVPGTPILCKDVIVSEYQIVQARSVGADAVLLIAEALTDEELKRFIERARELNMGVLVEAHESAAFGRAVASGAIIVGANARNLRQPKDLDISRARELHSFVRDDQVFVAESGIETVDDVRTLPERVDAVLIGTALMRAQDPKPLIRGIASIRRAHGESIGLPEKTR